MTGSALSGSNITDRQNSETQPLVMESREQEDPEDVEVYVENAATESSETVGDTTKVTTNFSPVTITENRMPKSMDASAVIHLEVKKMETVSQMRKMLKKADQLVTELENLKKDLESDKGERASVGAGIQEDIESTKADLRKLFVKLEEKNSKDQGW